MSLANECMNEFKIIPNVFNVFNDKNKWEKSQGIFEYFLLYKNKIIQNNS